jgi:hypothetical protein
MIGDQARFSVLDRGTYTAMGTALSIAEQAIGGSRRVVWVDNGPGSMFSLPKAKPGTVVVSDRAIELTGLIRKILLSRAPLGSLEKASEQKFFEIAAEQALLQGHAEPAVKALAMSVIDARFRVAVEDLRALANASLSAGYVATWCFGLLHEVGHLTPDQPEDFHPLTSDENILGQLEWLSRDWMRLPIAQVGDPCIRARERPESSVIGLSHLRSEVAADLFATHMLILATEMLMNEAGDPLDWATFIREAHAAQQVLVVFDRIKRAVALGASSAPSRDDAIEMMFHPLSVGVRNLAQQEYIAAMLTISSADSAHPPRRDDIDGQRAFVRGSIQPHEARFAEIDRALDTTIDFMLNRQRHIDQWQLLDRLGASGWESDGPDQFVKRFVDMAEGLGRPTDATRALRRLVNFPTEPRSAAE